MVIEFGSCGSKCNSNDPESSCYLKCAKHKPCYPGCHTLCDDDNTEEFCSKSLFLQSKINQSKFLKRIYILKPDISNSFQLFALILFPRAMTQPVTAVMNGQKWAFVKVDGISRR